VKLPDPGEYQLQVSAFNDITMETAPVTLNIHVINTTFALQASISLFGGLVGEFTNIKLNINAKHFPKIDINFGDGEKTSLTLFNPKSMVVMDDLFIVYIRHKYRSAGTFNIVVNVSNSVSHLVVREKFTPISRVTLTSRSTPISRSPSYVVAMATVEGGQDVMFAWNFSDPFSVTSVQRYV